MMKGSLSEQVDALRLSANENIPDSSRAEFAQFMTPAAVAQLMASTFDFVGEEIRLLDPGAGVGSLTAAVVERLCSAPKRPRLLSLAAYEIDATLAMHLHSTLKLCETACCKAGIRLTWDVRQEDYIASCAGGLFDKQQFNAVIMNPPYRKINSDSHTRRLLRAQGIETTNLYTAFMALAIRQLAPNGEFVSITPRSFCNGPYFRPFRREFFERVSLRRLHVFESRSELFKDDEVLQENIILHARRSAAQPLICISVTKADGEQSRLVPYASVIDISDIDAFIHISTDNQGDEVAARMKTLHHSPSDLGTTVSTGRVVDFRALPHLRQDVESSTVPLLYPCHMNGGNVKWPCKGKKPNAIVHNTDTENLLVPSGYYVLVKRFSAKEERKRIVAVVFRPEDAPCFKVGFENHINYYHENGHGLDPQIAIGLANFLNSSTVDSYFRLFNGHTQVNATDLRKLSYPSAMQLRRIAEVAGDVLVDQSEIDQIVNRIVFNRALPPVSKAV